MATLSEIREKLNAQQSRNNAVLDSASLIPEPEQLILDPELHYDRSVEANKTLPWSRTEESELLCPNCRGNYLHHKSVTVFDRTEDAVDTTVSHVEKGVVKVEVKKDNKCGNPSGRRDGIVIDFWCETCEAAPIQFTIAQHKGTTITQWIHKTSEVRFGKYKGKSVEAMLADKEYMTWLGKQDWAREKYPEYFV